MPRYRINVIYGQALAMTPHGLSMQQLAYGGDLDNKEHLEQVLAQWKKPPQERGSVKLTATSKELSNTRGILSAESHVDLTQAKILQIYEETDLDISASTGGIERKLEIKS